MRYINLRLLTYLLTCLVEMAIERRPHPCYRRTERLDGRTDGRTWYRAFELSRSDGIDGIRKVAKLTVQIRRRLVSDYKATPTADVTFFEFLWLRGSRFIYIMPLPPPPPHRAEALSDDAFLTSV